MTRPWGPGEPRPPTTGGLSIADRRTLTALARDVAIIRRWIAFFGLLAVLVVAGGCATGAVIVLHLVMY